MIICRGTRLFSRYWNIYLDFFVVYWKVLLFCCRYDKSDKTLYNAGSYAGNRLFVMRQNAY